MRSTWIRQISAIRKDVSESAINLTCGLNCKHRRFEYRKPGLQNRRIRLWRKETPTDKTAYEVAQVTFITNDGEVSLNVRLGHSEHYSRGIQQPRQLLPALILFHHVPANQSIRFFLPC